MVGYLDLAISVFFMFSFQIMRNEREAYEVIVENGKLVYKKSGVPVNTAEGSKWIFVLSTLRALYVGKVQILLILNS